VRSEDVLGVFFIFLAILVLVIGIYFQIQGAVQCAEDGGQYLRQWNGWPTCVMP